MACVMAELSKALNFKRYSLLNCYIPKVTYVREFFFDFAPNIGLISVSHSTDLG